MGVVRILSVGVLALAVPFGAVAEDEDWPKGPVTIVVPFPAGGATDVMARLFAPEISQAIDAPVIVENRAGAGGTIGTQYVARASDDGQTMLWGTVATHGIGPSIYKNLTYDVQSDFTPVVHAVDQPYVLVTHPSLGFTDAAAFIEHIKVNPDSTSAASAGMGTGAHMILEKFLAESDTQLLHVPYKGAGPAMIDVIGGQVDVAFDVILTTVPHIEGEKVIPLAVTGTTRSSALPEVPTMAEAGLDEFVAVGWNGLFARAGTPDHVVQKVNDAVNKALKKPEIRDRLLREGSIPVGGTPKDFSDFVDSELKGWGEIADQIDLRLD